MGVEPVVALSVRRDSERQFGAELSDLALPLQPPDVEILQAGMMPDETVRLSIINVEFDPLHTEIAAKIVDGEMRHNERFYRLIPRLRNHGRPVIRVTRGVGHAGYRRMKLSQ